MNIANFCVKTIIFFVFLLSPYLLESKTIRILPDKMLSGQLSYSKTTYVICDTIDLNGDTIILPYKSILKFEDGGCIFHGRIIGNESKIVADSTLIMHNIRIDGSWDNEKVFAQWINYPIGQKPANVYFACIMKLCQGKRFTHLYLPNHTFFVEAVPLSAPIKIPSNIYWHNDAIIQMLPNGYTKYSIVLLNKVDNIIIEGGIFIGDVTGHLGKDGEWGHGIKCSGATNVILKGVISRENWGDGIDLIEAYEGNNPIVNCDNIRIEDVKCLYNRRQGLSIEAAFNVSVMNSEFSFTGCPKYTPPAAGIDIEPWIANKEKIHNIKIDKCSFHNNKGFDVKTMIDWNATNQSIFDNNISIMNCEMLSSMIYCTQKVHIENCVINNLIVKESKDIDFVNCKINNFTKGANTVNMRKINTQMGNRKKAILASFALLALLLVFFIKSNLRIILKCFIFKPIQ